MKKNLKKISVFLLALLIACISIVPVLADTIYYDNGILYTYLNNDEVTVCGAAEGVTEVELPSYINYRMVVDIRNRAFLDNTEITTVDFTKITYLRRIGSFAFANCVNLDGEIVIPNTVTAMDTAAFQGCTSLDSVVFNASTGFVPNQCFSGCTSLNSVVLNDTVTEIGYYAFSNCPNLSYIEIPASVTSIAQSSFQNDTDITLGVYRNSYALEYAENNGIKYVILDPEPTEPPTELPTELPTEESTQPVTVAPTEASVVLLGDVNDDGVVDSIDTTITQRYLSGIIKNYSKEMIMHGDIDGDGIVTIIDVTYTMRYLASMNVPYPINKPISN